ncbi:DUF3455 domain-containing protein [Gemmata sp. G18]|uniref:DUF3455 domain-containing protein n=1 Tax=Gemmata palustris TaxID=2822762 RepID=A0ABS5C0U8_9BACT|nr:DUF3455 domain-containing protein [Gemmata palustris]MBP3959601.1 DUF3455 domain-containing protein [Gemmata palustris]
MTLLLRTIALLGSAWIAALATGAEVPEVPKEIAAPAGHKDVLAVRAKGVQIYKSVADKDGKLVWVLDGPLAELTDVKGARVGCHFEGPSWETADGSRLVRDESEKPKSVAKGAADIPWLLIRVKSDDAKPGALTKVAYVQRIETSGGKAPAEAPKRVGTKVGVPYEAKYVFFAPTEK